MNASGDGGPEAGRLTLYQNGFLVGPEDAPEPMFFCSVAGKPINASPEDKFPDPLRILCDQI